MPAQTASQAIRFDVANATSANARCAELAFNQQAPPREGWLIRSGKLLEGEAWVVVLVHEDGSTVNEPQLVQKVLHHDVVGVGVDA